MICPFFTLNCMGYDRCGARHSLCNQMHNVSITCRIKPTQTSIRNDASTTYISNGELS